jgi:hypothetical protein
VRRGFLTTLILGALIAAVIASDAGARTPRAARSQAGSCPRALRGATDLGRLAFIHGDQLRVVRLANCRVRTLVRSGVTPPLRWSADGRYLAYGSGSVVSAAGGRPSRPLGPLAAGWGSGSPGWVWSPAGHRLAGVTTKSGVAIGGPGQEARMLWRQHWGATSIAWSPNGRTLAVSRSLYLHAPAPYHQEIWLLTLATSTPRLLWHLDKPAPAPPWLSGFSPDGRWLLSWEDTGNSASIAADGVPLVLIPTGGGRPVRLGPELMYGDFVSWCGRHTLVYVRDHGGREVSDGDRITVTQPPGWPTSTPADSGSGKRLSYISSVCGTVGGEFTEIAAAGPDSRDTPFGHEHRSILRLSAGGKWTPLESGPPRGWSDELPMLSGDRRWIAFVRTSEKGLGTTARLYLLKLGAHFDGHARRIGPIAELSGSASQYGNNYYGHYGWASLVAWYSR